MCVCSGTFRESLDISIKHHYLEIVVFLCFLHKDPQSPYAFQSQDARFIV